MSRTTRVSLSDCFEQEASAKTLIMYKGLLENAMQMKKLTITHMTEVKMSV